MTVEVYQVHVT